MNAAAIKPRQAGKRYLVPAIAFCMAFAMGGVALAQTNRQQFELRDSSRQIQQQLDNQQRSQQQQFQYNQLRDQQLRQQQFPPMPAPSIGIQSPRH